MIDSGSDNGPAVDHPPREAQLLGPSDPAPVETWQPQVARPLVIVCDHAGRAIPEMLGDLGVSEHALSDHIAWDIGAAGVARRLARRFEARLVMGRYSRLVVDLNRDLADASAFPKISDGVLIPGNLGLTAEARTMRTQAIFSPYHEAVRAAIMALIHEPVSPVFIAVHSFTPRQHGLARPWHVGVLWDKDPRLALPLMAALRAEGDIVVGDNEPYSGRHPADFTVDHHAEPLGLAHVSLEIRQDLIADADGEAHWADRIGNVLSRVLGDDLCVSLHSRSA